MNVICTHLVNLNAEGAFGWFDEIDTNNPEMVELRTNEVLTIDQHLARVCNGIMQVHKTRMLTSKEPEASVTYDITLLDTVGEILITNLTLVAEMYQGGLSLYGYLATDKSDTEDEWLRVFGYSGTERGFHCDIPYVGGMAEGMSYQFWDEFVSIVPLDTINVLHYEHNRDFDIQFWERYDEVVMRQSPDYIKKYVLERLDALVSDNLRVPNLFTSDGYPASGTDMTKDEHNIISQLARAGRIDVNLLNMFHHTTLIGRNLLTGFEVKDVSDITAA